MCQLAPSFTDLAGGITAIDVDYGRPLAASSHLIVDDGVAAFIDTGTNHSVPLLLATLEQKSLPPEAVELVILTHVHLDHAGGAGRLMQALPRARCLVHPRGARHIVDPTRLVAGSIAVYGETVFRNLYGDLVPVDAGRVTTPDDGTTVTLGRRRLRFLYTEGHARHHFCIVDPHSAGVFTGDSFGVSYRELDTAAGEFIFPTTTPVHFDPPAAHTAIDTILAQNPQRLYLTHFSEVTDLHRLAGDLHECLDAFVAIVESSAGSEDRVTRVAAGIYEYLSRRLDAHGFAAGEPRRHAILDMDCKLNAQGLVFWHEHR